MLFVQSVVSTSECVCQCVVVVIQMEAVQKLAVHLWHEYEWTLTIAGHNAYTHYSVLTTLNYRDLPSTLLDNL